MLHFEELELNACGLEGGGDGVVGVESLVALGELGNDDGREDAQDEHHDQGFQRG